MCNHILSFYQVWVKMFSECVTRDQEMVFKIIISKIGFLITISGNVYLVDHDRFDVSHVNGLISWAERWQPIRGYSREMVAHQDFYTKACFTQVC